MKRQRLRSELWPVGCLLLAGLVMVSCDGEAQLDLVGTLERTTLELAAPIAEVITEQPVARGDRVQVGDLIVQLDTAVAEAELRAYEAARAAAAAALAEADGDYRRTEDLRKARVKSPQDLDRARRQRDEAAAVLAEKEARIAQARKRLDDLRVVSRAAGIVDQLPYEVGERPPAGGVIAVVLADQAPWVRTWIPARAVSRIEADHRVEVRVEGLEDWFAAHVEDIAREPSFTPHYALTEREAAHLVYAARVVLDEGPADLRPGLPARLRLRLDAQGER